MAIFSGKLTEIAEIVAKYARLIYCYGILVNKRYSYNRNVNSMLMKYYRNKSMVSKKYRKKYIISELRIKMFGLIKRTKF